MTSTEQIHEIIAKVDYIGNPELMSMLKQLRIQVASETRSAILKGMTRRMENNYKQLQKQYQNGT